MYCHYETGSCTHQVQLGLKQQTNFGSKEIVSSVLVEDHSLRQVQLSGLAAVIPNMHQDLCQACKDIGQHEHMLP